MKLFIVMLCASLAFCGVGCEKIEDSRTDGASIELSSVCAGDELTAHGIRLKDKEAFEAWVLSDLEGAVHEWFRIEGDGAEGTVAIDFSVRSVRVIQYLEGGEVLKIDTLYLSESDGVSYEFNVMTDGYTLPKFVAVNVWEYSPICEFFELYGSEA